MATKSNTNQGKTGPKSAARIADPIGTPTASAIMGLSVTRIQQFIWQGRLQGEKFEGRWRVSQREVEELAKVERPNGRPPDDSRN